ncbi:MAG: LPS assembly protein LptD [Pseudomonadota bacterium]
MHPLLKAFVLAAALPSLASAQPLVCESAGPVPLPPFAADLTGEQVGIRAPQIDLNNAAASVFSGGVDILSADQRLRAREVTLDRAGGIAQARGQVEYQSQDLRVNAATADVDLNNDTVSIETLDYWLGRGAGRGNATSARREGARQTDLDGVTFTTCPVGNSDWLIRADSMSLDHEVGRGTARDLTLRYKNVPLLYLPYASFPLDDRRQSGFLFPAIGGSNDDGLDLSIPYYFNIAPERDLTLTPRLITDRGPMLLGEYRYLQERSRGELGVEVLPDDDRTGTHRSYTWWRHNGRLGDRFQVLLDINHVSDDRYFEDLSNSLAGSSRSFLRSLAQISTAGRYFDAALSLDDYTSVDDTLAPAAEPYSRLPRLDLNLDLPLKNLRLRMDTELVAFDRDVGDEGWRLDLYPRLSRTFAGPAWTLRPALGVRHTRYNLDRAVDNGRTDTPSRTTPIAELEGRVIFERDGGSYLQTLEPRFYLLHVPFEDQSDLPEFDTRDLTFTFSQLFRPNRFSGADRQGDASQLTLALTSRIQDRRTGRDTLEFHLGTIVHLRDRRINLGALDRDDRDTSPLVAEMAWRPSDYWRVVLGFQYEPDPLPGFDRLQQRHLALGYRGDRGQILNFAYRQRSQVVDQVDLSAWWPLNERWALVGRANYSFQDDLLLEGLAGFEYSSCCWALRMMGRRFVRTLDGDQRNAIYFELELKGLGSLGRSTGRVLEQAISGYRYAPNETSY